MRGGRAGRAAAIAVASVLLGALATGCGSAAHDGGGGGADGKPAARASAADVTESLASDGTTVRVGSPDARTVVHVYEDARCPVCRRFETKGGGEALRDLVRSGQVRAEYTLASFLDDRLGGHGSQKAANALRAALDAGKFAEYHDVLYAHQPEESVDGFTDAFLLDMASRVKGLRSKEFDAAVKDMKYRSFVTASEQAFERSGATGTPALKVDGTLVDGARYDQIFDKSTLPLVIGALARD
ncbi:DsbA family protein [Streptomyces thermodiastaticus]|jgi:protein-disulfide isomerase|uniref:DsbA family protein n=1 Tax=Streptomyces thermodiastaticus TaxID=44061 RepID=UPI0016778258|nr:thioredoxin domain-containing protein [Streptomyces thermodiastaticus]MCE7550040.1 DsbA family protein [Streptomyces thermodiastaticus]